MSSQRTELDHLPRRLGVGALWLLIINGMIGAGIFGIPAEAARLVGDFSPLLFLLTALLMAPVLLCFAELSSATRETGGPARYVGIAFGPMAGFQAGWALYIARLTALAANFNLLQSALAHFWPTLGEAGPRVLSLGLLTALIAVLNIIGVRWAMRSLGVLTVGKLLPLLALTGFGLIELMDVQFIDAQLINGQLVAVTTQFATPSVWPTHEADIGAALLLMIYAFVGFESGLIPGGEARNPQRDMPRALLAAMLLCGALYALMQWVCLALLPELASTPRPLVALGEILFGPVGAVLVLATIILSVGGNLFGSMFSVPRVSYSLAREGLLPLAFAQISPRYQTPVFSIVVYALLGWALAASGSFVWLAALSVLTRLLIYLACIAAMPAVRRQAQTDAWRLRGGPILPLLGVAFCLALLTQVSWQSVLATVLLLAVGSLLYLLARWKARARD